MRVLAGPLSCHSFSPLPLLFCVFFAVEVLFLLPSNKKTKVKMKIKAKMTNCMYIRKRYSVPLFCSSVSQTDSLITVPYHTGISELCLTTMQSTAFAIQTGITNINNQS